MNSNQRPGTSDSQWQLAGALFTFFIMGIVFFGVWAFALASGASAMRTWYWPTAATVATGLLAYIFPKHVGRILLDLLKGFTGTEDS